MALWANQSLWTYFWKLLPMTSYLTSWSVCDLGRGRIPDSQLRDESCGCDVENDEAHRGLLLLSVSPSSVGVPSAAMTSACSTTCCVSTVSLLRRVFAGVSSRSSVCWSELWSAVAMSSEPELLVCRLHHRGEAGDSTRRIIQCTSPWSGARAGRGSACTEWGLPACVGWFAETGVPWTPLVAVEQWALGAE